MTHQPPNWAAQIMALSALPVPPDQFWPQYLSLVKLAVDAAFVDVFALDTPLGTWSPIVPSRFDFDTQVPPALLQLARSEGVAIATGLILSILPQSDQGRDVALILRFADQARLQARVHRVAGLAAVPALYQKSREGRLAARDALRLAQTLTIFGNLLDTPDFNAASTAVVNRLSEMFACEHVYLTWRRAVGQRLLAVSHGDLPQQRSTLAAAVEEMAQEALTQQSEVMFSPHQDADPRVSAQAAARFYDLARPGHVITLPMQDFAPDGEIVEWGAVVLTRSAHPFTEAEQWALRLIVEMMARVLADKSKALHILPLRLWHEMTRSAPKWMQVKTLPGRWLLGGSVAALLLLMLVPVPHSISATAVLKTEAVAFVGAPFSGFIKSSAVDLGDKIVAGQPLLWMATDELTLERETRLAELAQANRDAEINRAQAKLPEMQIAKSRADEIKTQLVVLDARIAAAQVTSPIQGVIVDGEPAKKLGQAISRGEMLVTIAQTNGLYVEAAVSERDLNLVQPGAQTRLTLLADPDAHFDMTVDHAIPAVRQQDAQNVFPVRMRASGAAPDWWLPGMTGVVRIQTGSAPLVWVLSRRLIDYVRLYLWV